MWKTGCLHWTKCFLGQIVSVHCLKSGWIGLYIPDHQEMSRGRSPRDISRAEGNLEVGGDVQPKSSRLEAVYGHSLVINPSLRMYQEIHPCRASSIDSVKFNTSLPMMREWICFLHIFFELAQSWTNDNIDRTTENFVISDESLLSGWINTDEQL